ncbi:hypothetical protein [Streptomyces sp. NRRL B-24484]|uniref:hypothetical protein n=1 Tax=Streptomyces sp. NRRL B-24484 TaxID=1463833 RepID=UPI0004BEAFD6|nr:hypothetical protein [Streptomyces sp. NRRL B-24484]
MRVRMLASISGTRDGQPWPPRGHTIDLPDDEAAQHIAQRTAEPADDEDGQDQEPEGSVGSGPDGGTEKNDEDQGDGDGAPEADTAEGPPAEAAEEEPKRGRGRPRLPRDGEGNIVREG